MEWHFWGRTCFVFWVCWSGAHLLFTLSGPLIRWAPLGVDDDAFPVYGAAWLMMVHYLGGGMADIGRVGSFGLGWSGAHSINALDWTIRGGPVIEWAGSSNLGCVGPINRHPLSSIGGPRRHPLVPVCLRNIICSCRSWTEKWLIDVWHIERWMARIFGIKALMSSIIESRSLEARTEKSLFETRGTLQCSCFYWKEASFSVFRVSSNFKLVPPWD